MIDRSRLTSAVRASTRHLLISAGVAACVAVLVFGVWYPWPSYKLIGGLGLFLIIMVVDVVCGPLLTLVLWNPRKPRSERVQDMLLVGIIQLAALGYGVHTMAMARPVYWVFEVDRIRLVTASEIDAKELPQAVSKLAQLTWFGPRLIATRLPQNQDELIKSVELSLAGKDPALRPDWWIPYTHAADQVRARARDIDALKKGRPGDGPAIANALASTGVPDADLLWLPLTSGRSLEWVVVLDKATLQPKAYVPVDGFF